MSPRHAAPPAWPRRILTVLRMCLAAVLLSSGLALLVTPPGRAAPAAATASSAVTVSGTGAFEALKVTVSQTASLVNQVVSLTWTGGAPTQPTGNNFALNYLQVMQCWGDDAAGPGREQCQFGGRAASDQRGGAYVGSRQLNYGHLVDPKEKAVAGVGQTYVPFRSVTGVTASDNSNQFFDSNTTNELPFLRTRPDGSGTEVFEVQTAKEAPGLGCGNPVSPASTTIRNCWLVVVPRGTAEVDGSVRTTASTNQLDSSPLSQSNWDQRLVFPMQFAPLGHVCPLGRQERRTVGTEMIVDAISRWQPVLCRTGPVYGFSQVPDAVARRQLASDSPGLAFLTRPVPSAEIPAGRSFSYAPVVLSGLTIGFDINSMAPSDASPQVRERDGLRVSDLKLTPRLVAKLLTQSYGQAAQSAPYLRNNPVAMTSDPDFLKLNPGFSDLALSLSNLIVPAGNADVYALLWQWIASDQDASDFVAGAPDPWGTRVNPFYQGAVLEDTSFAKADPYCLKRPGRPIPVCTLDAYPYAGDLHDGARAVARGDSLARTYWDPLAQPPAYKKVAVQPNGLHALMAVADSVTAQRFGLAVAALRNAAGSFVYPREQGLREGYAAMRPSSTTGVVEPDFANQTAGAYPLTVLTYAVTAPAALTPQEAVDSANLVRYAVGAGQSPGTDAGQLPAGYVPLPQALRSQALRVAQDIAQRRAPSPASSAAVTGTPNPPAQKTAQVARSAVPVAGRDAAPPATVPTPALAPSRSTPTPTVQALVPVGNTPAVAVGGVRYVLVVALLVGGLAAGFGPLVPRWVGRPER